jgi:hypothetical protein
MSMNSPASFLQGAIAARHLSSASVTPITARRDTYIHASNTQGVDCSLNPHIPACQPPTYSCTYGASCQDTPTGSFCPTREFVC